jgi:hypothetical protein
MQVVTELRCYVHVAAYLNSTVSADSFSFLLPSFLTAEFLLYCSVQLPDGGRVGCNGSVCLYVAMLLYCIAGAEESPCFRRSGERVSNQFKAREYLKV